MVPFVRGAERTVCHILGRQESWSKDPESRLRTYPRGPSYMVKITKLECEISMKQDLQILITIQCDNIYITILF